MRMPHMILARSFGRNCPWKEIVKYFLSLRTNMLNNKASTLDPLTFKTKHWSISSDLHDFLNRQRKSTSQVSPLASVFTVCTSVHRGLQDWWLRSCLSWSHNRFLYSTLPRGSFYKRHKNQINTLISNTIYNSVLLIIQNFNSEMSFF